MVTDELATRYGRPASPGRRRVIVGVLAVLVALAVGWAAYFAVTTGNPTVTWQDLGYRITPAGVDVTFEVTFDNSAGPSATAVCTAQAQNQVHTVVGSKDVRVGPLGSSGFRTLRIRTTVPTSEPAITGLVTGCTLT
jgi:hypothetical protein